MIMQKIIDYHIVSFVTWEQTQQVVLEYIKDGWQPLGGVSCYGEDNENYGCYSQAVVKYEETN